MKTGLLRIKRIHVNKLLNLYNHEIDLNLDEHITIIHGPNGVGKTVLLKLVSAVSAMDWRYIAQTPFLDFNVCFQDGSSLKIEQKEKGDDKSKEQSSKELHITFSDESGKPQTYKVPAKFASTIRHASRIADEIPFLRRIDEDKWIDIRDDEIIDADELVAQYGDSPTTRQRNKFSRPDIPEWLAAVLSSFKVHFIDTQRLIKQPRSALSPWHGPSDEQALVPSVRYYARNLKNQISIVLNHYAEKSHMLDQQFPQRLWETYATPSCKVQTQEADIKARLAELDEKRGQLQKNGLLDESSASPFDTEALDKLEQTDRDHMLLAMSLYADASEKKLEVLDEIAQRVDAFLGTINRKFRHKTLRINRETGFEAVDSDHEPLQLERLSSGEQHEIVLLYELLFLVKKNSLVLIDEPELSLHVSWQKGFLDDLLQVVGISQFDVLVATHSPYVAEARTDLMIALSDV